MNRTRHRVGVLAACLLFQIAGNAIDQGALGPVYTEINMKRVILTDEQIATALESLPGWEHADGALKKTFRCKDFQAAITFIVAFSYDCEEIDHHPDIYNVYSKVAISTTTHDVMNKVTETDVELAKRIEAISKVFL
jgi:4a-hydroxytetrahydrobiopterin dehydratase